MYKIFTLFIAICLALSIGFGQNIADSFNLPDQNTYASSHYMAKDKITLSDGFSWDSSKGTFHAEINGKLIQPDQTNTVGGPGGEIGNTGVVGNTSATYSVNSGNFNYTMPILVSPGVNGMQPSLSINYTNNSFPGLLAEKFDLGGLSAITRGGKNLFDDGEYKGIKWNNEDNLFWDGSRLIEYSSNKPTSVEYRLKTNNRLKIIAYNISSSGPEYFEVTDENGTIMEYGKTVDSKYLAYINAANLTYGWYLNKVTDIYGNCIKYNFSCDYTLSGSVKTNLANFRPTSVSYGNGSNLKGYVNFEYEGSIPSAYYGAGNKFSYNKRIKNITTGHNTQQLRRYHLEYNILEGKTFLHKVTEYGTDNTAHYNSIIFNYHDYPAHPSSHVDFNPLSKQCLTGDFNGDGKADLIGGKSLVYSGQSGHTPSGTCNFLSSGVIGVHDINSDGLEDVITRNVIEIVGEVDLLPSGEWSEPNITYKTVFTYRESDGNNFTIRFNLELEGNDKKAMVMDLNNDKKSELLIYDQSDLIEIYEIDTNTNNFIKKDAYTLPIDPSKIEIGSMNGDNNKQLYITLGDKVAIVAYNQSYELETIYTINLDRLENNYFGDFNGDGITDLFRLKTGTSMSFYMGTGNGYTREDSFLSNLNISNFPSETRILTSDFDGDGIQDIMAYRTSFNIISLEGPDPIPVTHFYFVLFSGGETFVMKDLPRYEQPWSDGYAAENYPVIADFDGDGASDVLNVFYQNGNKTKLVKITERNKNLALRSVSNADLTLSVSYQNLTDGGEFYQQGDQATFPLKKANSPIWLVSSIDEKITDNEIFTTNYTYKGLIQNLLGAGMLGFEQTEAHNQNTGTTSRTQYAVNTTRMFMYPQISESVHLDGGTEETWSRTTTTLSEIDLGQGRYHTYASNVVSENLKRNTKSVHETDQDGNGNQELQTTRVYDGTTLVFTQTVDPVFEINTTSKWIPGRTLSVSSTVSRPGQDDINHNSSFTYYSNGKLKDKTQEPGHQKQVKLTYQYDAFGNIGSTTTSAENDPLIPQDLRIITETFLYTADGRFLEKATNALNQYSSSKYDPISGAITEQTDINGLKSYNQYDAMNSTSLTIAPDGTTGYSLLKWIDPGDTDAPTNAYYVSESQTSLNKIAKSYYDKAGRTIRNVIEKPNESRSNKDKVYVDFEYYDTTGLLYRESAPHYKDQSDVLYKTHTYDNYQRPETVAHIDGSLVTYTYNDALRSVTATTTKGQSTTTVTQKQNALGEAVETTNNDGSKVKYTYYSNGLLKQSGVSGNNAGVVMTYDIHGNQLTSQTPNGGTSTNVYNAFGQVVSTTDARNLETNYQYDILGRIKQKEVQNGPTTTFVYDNKWKGALSTASSSNNFSIEYGYDNLGRQTAYTENIDNKTLTSSLSYDTKGRLNKYTYPSGFELTYHYKPETNHLMGISYGSDKYIWQAGEQNQYMVFENYTLGSLNPVEMAYDNYGRFTRKHLASYYDYNIGYDSKGNIDQRREDIYDNSESFVYDDLNRLQTISTYHNSIKVDERTFSYDAYSNITEQNGIDLTYNATKNNQLASAENDPLTLGYSGITYDTESNITQISGNTHQIEFTYGFDKTRRKSILKQNEQIVKTKYYQSNYEEVTENGETKKIHYISAPTGLAAINVMDNNNQNHIYFALTDHLGSLNCLIDESGNIAEEHAFDSWGNRRDPHNWGNASTTSSFVTDRGFTLHEHLSEFDLVHMNGRVYCPTTMQFVSLDPIIQSPQNSTNYNRYSYCMNNPINYTDPSGYKLAPVKMWIPGAFCGRDISGLLGRGGGSSFGGSSSYGGGGGGYSSSWNYGTIYNTDGVIKYGDPYTKEAVDAYFVWKEQTGSNERITDFVSNGYYKTFVEGVDRSYFVMDNRLRYREHVAFGVKLVKIGDANSGGGNWGDNVVPMDNTRIAPGYYGTGGDPTVKATSDYYMGGYMITQSGRSPSSSISPFELKGTPSGSVNVGGYSPSGFVQAAIGLTRILGGTPETNRWYSDYGDTIIYNRHCYKGCCDYPTLGINKKDTIIGLPITVTDELYKKFLGW